MNKKAKFSRQDFLKKITVTGIVASSSMRSYANSSNQLSTIPLPVSTAKVPEQEKKFVPVMITPFQQNGKIDLNGLSKLIDFYLAAGVKGLFANCLSSEMYHLDKEERLTLTQHVVRHVKKVVPV